MSTPREEHDLGLRPAQERRAIALSASSVVVDLLAPSPAEAPALAAETTSPGAVAPQGPLAGGTARRTDVDPASLLPTPQPPETWSTLPVARTVDEIRGAARDGRRVVYLGARAVTDPAALEALHPLGLRTVGFGAPPPEGLADREPLTEASGLTVRGDRLLRAIDRLGIVVDVAGADRATAFDVAMRAAGPIVASRVVLPGERSGAPAAGTDELRAIASTDGVVGVGPVPAAASGGRAPLDGLLDRIDAVAACVGSRYVALGLGDALGAGDAFRTGEAPPADRSITVPALTNGLVARGYTDGEILGILGENALRVFAAVWG